MAKVSKKKKVCKFCGGKLSSLGFFCDDCNKEQEVGTNMPYIDPEEL